MIIRSLLPSEDHGFQLFHAQQKFLNNLLLRSNCHPQFRILLLQYSNALLSLRLQQTIISPLDHPPIDLFLRKFLHAEIVEAPLS